MSTDRGQSVLEDIHLRVLESELRARITRWATVYLALVGSLLTIVAYLGVDAFLSNYIRGAVRQQVEEPISLAKTQVEQLVTRSIQQRVETQSLMEQSKLGLISARRELEQAKTTLEASLRSVEAAKDELRNDVRTAQQKLRNNQINTEAAFDYIYDKTLEKTTRQLLLRNDVGLAQQGIKLVKDMIGTNGQFGRQQAQAFAEKWNALSRTHQEHAKLITARSRFKVVYFTRDTVGKAREKQLISMLVNKGYVAEPWYFNEPATYVSAVEEMTLDLEAPPQYLIKGQILVFANSGDSFITRDLSDAIAAVQGPTPLFRYNAMNPKKKLLSQGGFSPEQLIVVIDLSYLTE